MHILSEFGPESECTCKVSAALIQKWFTCFTLGLDPWILSGKARRLPVPWQRCRQLLALCGCRVSIPRSVLLPAYKYRAHRRRSFEPADDLALPSVSCCSCWWHGPSWALLYSKKERGFGTHPPRRVSTKIFDMPQWDSQNILWCVLSSCLWVSDVSNALHDTKENAMWSCILWGQIWPFCFRHWPLNTMNHS